MIIHQKNQCSENEYTTQSNLQIQCNLRKLEQIISQFVWKYKKTLNSQSNLEKEEWNWRNQPAWLQAILQSHSHQDSMVLAQRQKRRSMEQNRKPRDKSTHLWTPYLWQRRQEYTMEKRQSLEQVVLEKLINHLWKNETRTFSNIIQNKKLKWIKDLNVKPETI